MVSMYKPQQCQLKQRSRTVGCLTRLYTRAEWANGVAAVSGRGYVSAVQSCKVSSSWTRLNAVFYGRVDTQRSFDVRVSSVAPPLTHATYKWRRTGELAGATE